MPTPTIRPATLEDLPAIVALIADDQLGSAREDASLPLHSGYLAAFDAIAADRNQVLAVMADGAAIIGTLQLTFLPGISRKGGWRGQIEAVRIAANRRGQRLGETLIAWAVAQCRARGCGMVQLTTDKSRAGAHRFYDRLGFTPSHLGYKLTL